MPLLAVTAAFFLVELFAYQFLKNESAFLGTAADGTLIGPAFYLFEELPRRYFNMKVIPVTSTMAAVQFESDAPLKGSMVQLREKGRPAGTFKDWIKGSTLSFVSLDKLKPATEYSCIAVSSKSCGYTLGNHYAPLKASYKKSAKNYSQALTFKTPAADPAPRELHVSVKGDDKNPGTADKPYKNNKQK